MRLIGPIGLLGLLAACTDGEPAVEAVESGRPVALGVYVAKPLTTRADSTVLAETGIPFEKSIGVYAYYHDGSTWAADAAAEPPRNSPDFMFNQEAVNIGMEGYYRYSPLKYWPNETTDKLSFIAYYPYRDDCSVAADDPANEAGLQPLFTNSDTGLPTFSFVVKDDVKKQVDFLVSGLLPDLPNGTAAVWPGEPADRDELTVTDRVRFVFAHATAKVEFRIAVDEEVRKDLAYFTLHGISLTNIYKQGTLTPAYDDGTGNTTLTWSGHSDKHDYACKTTEAYLLLPQTLDNDARLSISYDMAFKSNGTTYTYDGSGNLVPTDDYVYTDRSSSVQLNTLKVTGTGAPLTAWLPNHHYVYTIRLGAYRIDFTGQVVGWGDEDDLDLAIPEDP